MKGIAYAKRIRLAQDIPTLGQSAVMAQLEQFSPAQEVYNQCPAPSDHGMPLKAIVFNMERGKYIQETVEFLSNCPDVKDADIILANELDDGARRTGCRDTAQEIAKMLHLNYTFGLEFIELSDPEDPKGYHGNAIFSRWPIMWAQVFYLPQAYDWYRDGQKRIGGRMAIFAMIETGDCPTGVVCVHLENRTDSAGRARQMQAVLEEADRLFAPGVPVILGGDLNTNTFDGRDPREAAVMLAEQQRGASERDVPAFEPLLTLAEQFAYDFRSFNTVGMTRRKPFPDGVLLMQLDWIMARGMECIASGIVSTRTADCSFAKEGSALASFPNVELSDHNVVWATCRRQAKLTTVLFDMGGTLEDVRADSGSLGRVTELLMKQLDALGHKTELSHEEFSVILAEGVARYKKFSQKNECELPVKQIWGDYYLRDFGIDRALLDRYAERFAGQWEVTYYTRTLRPGAKELLEKLRQAGYRLGVVSNNTSLCAVFDMLKKYEIRHLFEEVTVSSGTGFRKPAPEIFRIAMLRMNVHPEECIYVGDTVSRDIVGPRRAGIAATIHIDSALTALSDTILTESVSGADYEICELTEIAAILNC